MKIGFGKQDITPRVGVELCGFGPFLNRHSIAIRDRLWARAMAIQQGGKTLMLVSCDLVGVNIATTHAVRRLVQAATGIDGDAVMVHCTHTHSGPNTDCNLSGWGVLDPPYLECLPQRIARACIDAVAGLTEATISHAEVPCEGVALNREYDVDAPPLDEVLRDDWRPAKPELTDTTCHVLKVEAAGRMIGFVSYFGCHPVVCCQATRYIHGDFVGVATGMLEREHPGAVGLFLQGAQGDVNSCVVHKPEQEALLALDIIAARYANAVRASLSHTTVLLIDDIDYLLRQVTFSRVGLDLGELRQWLAEQEAIVQAPDARDDDIQVRMATVYVLTLRRLIGKLQSGMQLEEPTELQAFRLGPLTLLGTPFEIFQAVKNDVIRQAASPLTLVMGLTNDSLGYAPDNAIAARGGYAAQTVPIMQGSLPYKDIHTELVRALLELNAAVAPAVGQGA